MCLCVQDADVDRRVRQLEDQLRTIKAGNSEWEKKFQ